MDQEELSKRVNRKLSEFSPHYEIGAWEAFETYHQKKHDRRRIIGWWQLVAAACLFGLMGSWGYVWLHQPDQQQLPAVASRRITNEDQLTRPPATHTSPERSRQQMENTHNSFDQSPHRTANQKSDRVNLARSTDTELRVKRNNLSVVPDVAAHSTHPKPLLANSSRKALHSSRAYTKWPTKSVTDQTQNNRYSRFDSLISIDNEKIIYTQRVALPFLSIAARQLPIRPFSLPTIAIKQKQSEVPFHKLSTKEDGIRIGAGITSQANYAQANSASLQPGALIAAEIPLTSRLRIRSGLGILNQTISLTNQPTQQQLATGTRQLTTASYHWLNIDLPFAIRYNLSRSPVRPVFATLGFSSIAFLDGRYEQEFRTDKRITTTITLQNGQTQQVEQEVTQVEQQQGGLTETAGWQPFRFLNASMGFERKIAKQHFLLVEPFAKLPLGGITSENLRFSTFGVQVHWSYQLKRKPKSPADLVAP